MIAVLFLRIGAETTVRNIVTIKILRRGIRGLTAPGSPNPDSYFCADPKAILNAGDSEIASRGMSRTVSLFQLVLGVVLEKGFAHPVLADRHFAVVTTALETHFPATKQIPVESQCILNNHDSINSSVSTGNPA